MRQDAAVAWAETMSQKDAAGNRARADWNAYESGLPKQTFVMEEVGSPLAAFMQRMADRRAAQADVIEGESRIVE